MPLTFLAPPRIAPQRFAQLLQRGRGHGPSPAAALAHELYQICVGYGIDPAVALAFFAHESHFGTTGICKQYETRNWGNLRSAYQQQRAVGVVHTPAGDYVRFRSWQDGLRDWCERIVQRYVRQWGLETVEQAIPRYARGAAEAEVQQYVAHVLELVAGWQAEELLAVPAGAAAPGPDAALDLDELQSALFAESLRAAGLPFAPDQPFQRYALAEARAGRALGSPLGDCQRLSIGGRSYAVQVFACDTLYLPLAEPESATNWTDVRRLSELLRQS